VQETRAVRPSISRKSHALMAAQAELRGLLLAGTAGDKRATDTEFDRLDKLAEVFASCGDEQSLGRVAYIRANAYWDSFRLGAAESALVEAVGHARRSESHHDVARALESLTAVLLHGPHPVRTAVAWCEEIADGAYDDPTLKAKSLLRIAHLNAMQGRFPEAESQVEEARTSLHEINHRHAEAVSSHEAGMVQVLAGRLEAAEAEFKTGIETLEVMGDGAALATSAAYLADVLCKQGRLEEALHWTEASEATWGNHPYGIVEWGPTRAKIQARFGHVEVAEHLGRAALRAVNHSDDILARAHASLGLADVCTLAGKYTASDGFLTEAADLYKAKGATVLENMVRSRLNIGA